MLKRHLAVAGVSLAVAVFAFAGSANAVVIGFEGIATAGFQTTELNSTRTFSGFDVLVPHGHYQGRPFLQPPRPDSGSDWLLHDHATNLSPNQPVEITVSGGGVFNFTSIRASEWENTFALGQTMTLTGHFSGGGTIVANLVTDNAFGFETFVVAGFIGITQLDIIGSSATQGSCGGFAVCGSLGYDDIVVNAIPLPPALLLYGTGLTVLGFMMRRRRKAS